MQLLAAYRLWSIIEYWFPYRNLLDEEWDGVLTEFVPRVIQARDEESYWLVMLAMVARVHDTHANVWNALGVRPPTGTCRLPVHVRFVGGGVIVRSTALSAPDATTGLQIGDEITAFDGVPIETLLRDWAPYYAASNEPTRLRDIARRMTRGACGGVTVGIRRGETESTIDTQRVSAKGLVDEPGRDLPGPSFRFLSDEVAYLKLSNVRSDDLSAQIESASKTRGLIVDIRNYPSEFVVFKLGQLFVDKPTPFARFTVGDPLNPGAFHWTLPQLLLPMNPHYPGKVVVLLDEVSQSQAEYTAMALRAAGAIVVGSRTAGADGNVSGFTLPGDLRLAISGIGVFYPDKRPTQRIGIVPDIEVRPTTAGVRAGRDEVLEAGIRAIIGEGPTVVEVEAMSRPER